MQTLCNIVFCFRWPVEVRTNSSSTSSSQSYRLSICGPLQGAALPDECKDRVSVCRTVNNQALSIGANTDTFNLTEDKTKKELWLHLTGAQCPQSTTDKLKTVINFKCGKTLVSTVLTE